jgi:hypothetical protein
MDERHTFHETTTTMSTTFGQQIFDLLAMTHSVARLVEFLRDGEHFNEHSQIDNLKYGYLYSIPIAKWTSLTGIDTETLSTRWGDTDALPLTDDGRIWVDYYFERDAAGDGYQEDEGPMYVFISLDDYNGEFDDDEARFMPISRSVSV